MAVSAYLNFFGKADGESTTKGREKWVNVRSWEWRIDAPSAYSRSSGAAVGKPAPSALTFRHYLDSASPALLGHIATGVVFTQAQLVVTLDSAPAPFMTATLDNVYVTSVRTAFDGDLVAQEVDLVFKAIRLEYRGTDSTGNQLPAKVFTYDVVLGTGGGPPN